jgi:hypothetical protein
MTDKGIEKVRLTDEEQAKETEKSLQNNAMIHWEDLCSWFKPSYCIRGEQAVLNLLDDIAGAQILKLQQAGWKAVEGTK